MFLALSLRFLVALPFLGPLWLVVKFAENGCLLDYVRKYTKQDYGNADYVNTSNEENESKGITQVEKLRLAYGIAKGMDHLAKMKARMPFVLILYWDWGVHSKETDFPPYIMTNHQALHYRLQSQICRSLLQLLLAGGHSEIICSDSTPPAPPQRRRRRRRYWQYLCITTYDNVIERIVKKTKQNKTKEGEKRNLQRGIKALSLLK